MKWYFQALRKYAVFAGRAGRKEFWTFGLIQVLIFFALKRIDFLIGTVDHDSGVGLVSAVYELATLLPVIAVAVRRLHDTNRSGWWYFIIFIPVFGIVQLLIFAAQGSQMGENRYGPDPRKDRLEDTTVQGSVF